MADIDRPFIVVARVERHGVTGDVDLHLIRDKTTVDLHDGDEFLTVALRVDPFDPIETPEV